jgi:hypothetical protein
LPTSPLSCITDRLVFVADHLSSSVSHRTEGDRGRRYILSYERLVNRRIDTFLKVRKASATGELDLIELAEAIGTEELADLVEA